MVQIDPLLYAISVLSQFTSPDSTSNGLAVRQSFSPSSLPSACQSPCQVVYTMSNCGSDLSCLCASAVGSQLQQCMNCLVSVDPTVQSAAQGSLSGWNLGCNGTLTLGGSSSGGTTSGTTSGTTPATTTGTTSSGGSGSNPFAATGGGISLKTSGSMAVCIVAALVGACMFV